MGGPSQSNAKNSLTSLNLRDTKTSFKYLGDVGQLVEEMDMSGK